MSSPSGREWAYDLPKIEKLRINHQFGDPPKGKFEDKFDGLIRFFIPSIVFLMHSGELTFVIALLGTVQRNKIHWDG